MAGVDAPLTSLDEEDAHVWALRETGGEYTAGGTCGDTDEAKCGEGREAYVT